MTAPADLLALATQTVAAIASREGAPDTILTIEAHQFRSGSFYVSADIRRTVSFWPYDPEACRHPNPQGPLAFCCQCKRLLGWKAA